MRCQRSGSLAERVAQACYLPLRHLSKTPPQLCRSNSVLLGHFPLQLGLGAEGQSWAPRKAAVASLGSTPPQLSAAARLSFSPRSHRGGPSPRRVQRAGALPRGGSPAAAAWCAGRHRTATLAAQQRNCGASGSGTAPAALGLRDTPRLRAGRAAAVGSRRASRPASNSRVSS